MPIRNTLIEKEEREYSCGYCKHKFTRLVGKYTGRGKHQTVSSKVKCPCCGNFLKTWNHD